MTRREHDDLELLARIPDEPAKPTPLLFIHGAYTAAWCWDEHFLPWFRDRGYASYAVSLSGHGGSRRKSTPLDSISLADYVDDVLDTAARLPAPPVLIGHSMGGMVVQKALERIQVPAAVLMCSVPPQGLMASAVGLMMSRPNLLTDLNRILGGGQPHPESLREALFHQPIDHDKLMRYYRACQPESHRAIWDMTLFNLPHPSRMHRTPMLVLGAEFDHLIPPSQVHMTASTYETEAVILPGMGHGLMLEHHWRMAAERISGWLEDALD